MVKLRARLRSDGVIPGRWCFIVRVDAEIAIGGIYRQDADPLDEDEAKQATVLLESAGYEVERID